jgi:hypothetical protein
MLQPHALPPANGRCRPLLPLLRSLKHSAAYLNVHVVWTRGQREADCRAMREFLLECFRLLHPGYLPKRLERTNLNTSHCSSSTSEDRARGTVYRELQAEEWGKAAAAARGKTEHAAQCGDNYKLQRGEKLRQQQRTRWADAEVLVHAEHVLQGN